MTPGKFRDPGAAIEASWAIPRGTILAGRDQHGEYWIAAAYAPAPPSPPSQARVLAWDEPGATSCYCAVLGRMAPCGWCTDPKNDPDREEDEDEQEG